MSALPFSGRSMMTINTAAAAIHRDIKRSSRPGPGAGVSQRSRAPVREDSSAIRSPGLPPVAAGLSGNDAANTAGNVLAAPSARLASVAAERADAGVDGGVEAGVEAGVPPAQDRAHDEIRLLRAIGVFRADWASPARPAARGHAILAGWAFQMACAGGDVIAEACERPDRASAQAPASCAGFARARDRRRLGDDKLFAQPKRAAVGLPESVIRMN